MILGGKLFRYLVRTGKIVCYRNEERIGVDDLTINSNSINVSLSPFVLAPSYPMEIDLHDPSTLSWVESTFSEFHLAPGKFYLMSVQERFEFKSKLLRLLFAPMIEGRSTIARCGVSAHECAGYGDVGFDGAFTLEVSSKLPVVLRPGDEIAQVYFIFVLGGSPYKGAYQKQSKPKGPVIGKGRFVRH